MPAADEDSWQPSAARRSPQEGLRADHSAFFLDVDGTLLEIAPTPSQVIVDADLLGLLRRLALIAHGAIAFVSGRNIAALDQLFHPLMLPAAGLHGFERRTSDGTYHRCPLPRGEYLSRAREVFESLTTQYPELLLEDKRFALALHYRQAPQLEEVVLEQAQHLARDLAPDLELQRGHCVVELRPASASKAAAVAAFMSEPPFAGRRPVCLGDDLTDESAFDWVNQAGGISIAVGVRHQSHATAHLGSVAAARMWLRRLTHA